jgi:hypothetical protein
VKFFSLWFGFLGALAAILLCLVMYGLISMTKDWARMRGCIWSEKTVQDVRDCVNK